VGWEGRRSLLRRLLGAVCLWIAGRELPATAATFEVDPVQIYLSAAKSSEILELRNTGDARVRFQISVFSWSGNAKGAIVLNPTRDIIFYPSLLELVASNTGRFASAACCRRRTASALIACWSRSCRRCQAAAPLRPGFAC